MPVIINEFEVIAESQPPQPPEEPTPPEPEEAIQLRPADIIRMQQCHQLRLARVWAD